MIALLPMFAQLGLYLIEYFVKKKALNAEDKKIFVQVAEALRRNGAINVKSRYEAEEQISAIDQAWDERSKR